MISIESAGAGERTCCNLDESGSFNRDDKDDFDDFDKKNLKDMQLIDWNISTIIFKCVNR